MSYILLDYTSFTSRGIVFEEGFTKSMFFTISPSVSLAQVWSFLEPIYPNFYIMVYYQRSTVAIFFLTPINN